VHAKKLICILTGIFLLVSAIFIGCAPAKKPTPNQTNYFVPTPARKAPAPTPAAPLGPATKKTPTEKSKDVARANKITQKVDAVSGVKKCAAVVSGNTVYVGVDLEDRTKKEATEIKVFSQVAAMDPLINTVYVTSDPDLFQRLSKISDGIAKGKPVQDYQKDLNEIATSTKTRKTTP